MGKGKSSNDPLHWEPWQRQWYRQALLRTLPVGIIHTGLYFGGALWVELQEDVSMYPKANMLRTVATVFGCLLSLITIVLDIGFGPPPLKKEPKESLLRGNMNGFYSYLTFHILSLQCIYWVSCTLVEIQLIYNPSSEYISKLSVWNHSASCFVNAFGLALAVLFLKFNWFEPVWRKQVLELAHSKGHSYLGPLLLFTHLNQTPMAIIDILAIKHNEMLHRSLPSTYVAGMAIAAYALYYSLATNINFSLTKQYPYPFLHKVFATWPAEIAFVFGVFAFIVTLFVILVMLAENEYHIIHWL